MLQEIISDIKDINPTRKDLRNFAFIFWGVLTVFSVLLLRKHSPKAYWTGTFSLIFLGTGLIYPDLLYHFYKIWVSLAVVMGFFMIRIILTIMFFVIFTPVGVVLRLFKKDILNQRIDKTMKTYWLKKEKQPFDQQRYEKLF